LLILLSAEQLTMWLCQLWVSGYKNHRGYIMQR